MGPDHTPSFISLKFYSGTLTVPIGAGADTIMHDRDPDVETYPFNPKGVVVDATQITTARLLGTGDLGSREVTANTLFNRRVAKTAPESQGLSAMTISLTTLGVSAAALAPSGDLTADGVPALRAAIARLAGAGRPHVVIILTEVTGIDAAAFFCLLDASRVAGQHGGSIRVAADPAGEAAQAIRAAFRNGDPSRSLAMFGTVEAAVRDATDAAERPGG